MKSFTLFLILILVQVKLNAHETKSSNFSKLSVLFKNNLIRSNSTAKDYQLKLLKNRNHACLLREYATLEDSELKFTSIGENITDLWENSKNTDDFTFLIDNTVSFNYS